MHVCPALLLAASLSFFCTWGEAVSIYKYRLANGTTLYSQTPGKRGVLLEVLHISPPTRADIEAGVRTRQEMERDMVRGDHLTAIRHQHAEQSACTSTVVAGMTAVPQPGERTGTVGGYSRLNDFYWQRLYGTPLGTGFILDAPDPSRTEYERLK